MSSLFLRFRVRTVSLLDRCVRLPFAFGASSVKDKKDSRRAHLLFPRSS